MEGHPCRPGFAYISIRLRLRHFNEQCEAEPKNRLHNYDRLFLLMGFTSSSTALSGIEDLIRGPVTKELILEQIMYEKTWSRGSGRYTDLFPSQSSGRFNVMMSDGKGKYVHFSVSPQDEAFLDEMTKGLTLHNNPVKVEKLRQSVEEKHKSFAMYQGDDFDNYREVRYKVTYYPESCVFIQTERIDDT